MTVTDIPSAVAALTTAETSRTDRGRLTDEWSALDEATAYRVQRALIDARLAGGERLVGFKLGLTSRPKQERMGVDAPITGWLTDAHRLDAAEPVVISDYIHPRIEPEIVLVLRDELVGPGCTREDVIAATAEVRAGFEIIDSRYRDFSFALPDVVADNASAAGFHVGDTAVAPAEVDLVNERLELLVDGEIVDAATGAAIQGDPWGAVAEAVNAVTARGQAVPARALVLAGALTDAVFLRPGSTYTARFSTLGELSVTAE